MRCSDYAGQRDGDEGQLVDQCVDVIHGRYVTAVPFLPAPDTPAKELHTGEVAASSPVFGLSRVFFGELDDERYLCVGDSVRYAFGEERGRIGRIIGLAVSDELQGVVARIRRYMTAAAVVEVMPSWQDGAPSVSTGLFETCWDDLVLVKDVE
eukprot:49565-Eustigmatos_ZCMA.PRE.1